MSDSCDPMDCSATGSSVHWISQAKLLEWLPFPSPRDLPDPGIKPSTPSLQAKSLPTESSGRPISQSQRNEHNKTKTDTFATIQWHQLSSPKLLLLFSSVQFSSVTQSCPTLCDPMNCSMPALPIHHQLPEFTQTHVHQIGDAIQPSHPLTSPSLPAPNPSQH